MLEINYNEARIRRKSAANAKVHRWICPRVKQEKLGYREKAERSRIKYSRVGIPGNFRLCPQEEWSPLINTNTNLPKAEKRIGERKKRNVQ